MTRLLESTNFPSEGFFWIINDKVVGLSSEVPTSNYQYELDGKTHQNTWRLFQKDYLVNGHEVPYDYYPRGRIMIDPHYDLITNKFTEYSCIVFLDKCINNDKYKRIVTDYYNLDLKTIPYISWVMLGERAGIDHYTCHMCRGDN